MSWHAVWQATTEVWAESRGLRLGVWWQLVLLAGGLAGLLFDSRHLKLLGLNPWVKPIKFDLSVLVFLLTMAVLLHLLGPRWPAIGGGIGWVLGVAMAVENTVISLQSLRGVRSHMNVSTPANAVAWGLMGTFILIATLATGVLLVLYLRAGPSPATGLTAGVLLGARLGLLVFLAGSLEGVYMIGRYQAHTVGAADGGAGLPFVNWSTGHGDLRVAHFFALHALQLFPLAGWAMSRLQLPGWLPVWGTLAFAVVYSVVVWLLFAQAVRGQPVLRLAGGRHEQVQGGRHQAQGDG